MKPIAIRLIAVALMAAGIAGFAVLFAGISTDQYLYGVAESIPTPLDAAQSDHTSASDPAAPTAPITAEAPNPDLTSTLPQVIICQPDQTIGLTPVGDIGCVTRTAA